jgi:hypothetical protein
MRAEAMKLPRQVRSQVQLGNEEDFNAALAYWRGNQ